MILIFLELSPVEHCTLKKEKGNSASAERYKTCTLTQVPFSDIPQMYCFSFSLLYIFFIRLRFSKHDGDMP